MFWYESLLWSRLLRAWSQPPQGWGAGVTPAILVRLALLLLLPPHAGIPAGAADVGGRQAWQVFYHGEHRASEQLTDPGALQMAPRGCTRGSTPCLTCGCVRAVRQAVNVKLKEMWVDELQCRCAGDAQILLALKHTSALPKTCLVR